MTASMVSGFNSKQEGKQTIKVEYKNLQGKFQVNVVDKIKGISMNSEPDKIQYNYGENIDLTGASIAVVKSSGTTNYENNFKYDLWIQQQQPQERKLSQ